MNRNLPLMLGLLPFFIKENRGSATRKKKKKKKEKVIIDKQKEREFFENVYRTAAFFTNAGTPIKFFGRSLPQGIYEVEDPKGVGEVLHASADVEYFENLGPEEHKRNNQWFANIVIKHGMNENPSLFVDQHTGYLYILHASKFYGTYRGVEYYRQMLGPDSKLAGLLRVMSLPEYTKYVTILAAKNNSPERIGLNIQDLHVLMYLRFGPEYVLKEEDQTKFLDDLYEKPEFKAFEKKMKKIMGSK